MACKPLFGGDEKERRKNDCRTKNLMKGGLYIRLYHKTGWTDFNKLWVTDSVGTNSQT